MNSKFSAEEMAYYKIIDLLLSKNYAPGDRLVETELAEMIGVSRTPIRNALRKLIAEGLLVTGKNKGCYIPHLNAKDMKEVFDARIFLEGKAAFEAAYHRTQKDIENLSRIIEEEKEYYRTGDVANYTEANKNLHLTISALARNAYIDKFVRQTFWRSELYIFYFDRFYAPDLSEIILRDPHKSKSCIEHEKIVKAIIEQDPSGAEIAMKAHLKSTYEYLSPRFLLHGPSKGVQPEHKNIYTGKEGDAFF
jgi:DNA-binding GntR family transcriptional regulator